MKFYFLSIFPELFDAVLKSSILGRALNSSYYDFDVINIRDFAVDKHRSVDDHPYGGGAGMVMRADVLELALLAAFKTERIQPFNYNREEYCVIVTSASGESYTQEMATRFARYKAIFIVCGHYEGIDQRFIDLYADIVLRIGDYVLTGGELPALVVADSVVRLLPGVLGSEESVIEESFSFADEEGLLLEYPHYTRPAMFHEIPVPDILTSGNHAAIGEWRLAKSRELRLLRARK